MQVPPLSCCIEATHGLIVLSAPLNGTPGVEVCAAIKVKIAVRPMFGGYGVLYV